MLRFLVLPIVLFSITGLLSLACIYHLWARNTGGCLRKLAWTVAIAMPGLGPVAYGALYHPPNSQAGVDRADFTSTGGYTGGGGF